MSFHRLQRLNWKENPGVQPVCSAGWGFSAPLFHGIGCGLVQGEMSTWCMLIGDGFAEVSCAGNMVYAALFSTKGLVWMENVSGVLDFVKSVGLMLKVFCSINRCARVVGLCVAWCIVAILHQGIHFLHLNSCIVNITKSLQWSHFSWLNPEGGDVKYCGWWWEIVLYLRCYMKWGKCHLHMPRQKNKTRSGPTACQSEEH